MFTGIIETTAPIQQKSEYSITIGRPKMFDDLRIGMSIANNGACLSVTDYNENHITFDVLSETFRKTNIATVNEVNLERAMPANGRFEGHMVLGHVDGTTTLTEKKEEKSGTEYVFDTTHLDKKYIIPKGSITINGTSLTIGNITPQSFSVFLIPITLQHTTFGSMKNGDVVNIEYDYIIKSILHKQNIFDT